MHSADAFLSIRHLLMLTLRITLFLLLLPVIVLLVAVMHWRNDARMSQMARVLPCYRCGKTLGTDAIRLADRVWIERLDSLKKCGPPWRMDQAERTTDAICSGCGSRYCFIERTGHFARED